MFQSIVEDIKGQFRYGNMVSRIILVNFALFLLIVFVKVFTPGQVFESELISWLAMPGDGGQLIRQPWSIFTYMILHTGLWHIAWNMITLYWFGRILGDLLGDRRILPLYILGGLSGALLYFIYASLVGVHGILMGASGAVMCIIVAAAFTAPEYIIHLILIGPVRLKYVALVLFLIDIVMISQADNTGGHFAHIGGAIFGAMYVMILQRGIDLTKGVSDLLAKTTQQRVPKNKHMKIVHKQKERIKTSDRNVQEDLQDIVDDILDKINATGYDSLTDEEKEVLYRASKK